MKGLIFSVILIILLSGCSTNDSVTITADRNSYTPLISSAQGITLTPDFKTKTDYKNLVYHWETREGEFIGIGKEVNNQGEAVLWSAIEKDKIAEITNDFDIKLEVQRQKMAFISI
jgi:hypothetical protein